MNVNKINYQRETDRIIEEIRQTGKTPRLLLHACCAPCASYVLEYLTKYFEITVLYFNPNISPEGEYNHRVDEIKRLISEMPKVNGIDFLGGRYCPTEFYDKVKGLENVEEGGERCFLCYRMRMEEAARIARDGEYDFFTTTLTVGPLKNSGKLNEIGAALAEEYGVRYLFSDFKKNNGYKRSVELSKEYGLYRQNFCGCIYSKMQRENKD